MTIQIALLADPHLCVQERRKNAQSLFNRKPWRQIDAFNKQSFSGQTQNFSLYKPTSHDDIPLLAAADFIGEHSSELDMLVLLGDLATTGLEEDLEVAERVFLNKNTKEHLSASLEPRFGGLGVPLHILPGNHDRYKDDFGTPGCTRFDEVFREIYKPRNGVCLTEINKGSLSLGIVSADFCFADGSNPGLIRKYGRGIVHKGVLSELDTQTRTWQNRNPKSPVIWALHFSPSENVSNRLILEQREEVTHLANHLDVKHIFCGHTHIRKREVGIHPHIYCCGTVSSVESRYNHFLHICNVSYDNNGATILEVRDYKYSEDEDEFLHSPVSIAA